MRVILLENIKNFGKMGNVKNVADGYARNFLLPRKMAKLATDVALKEIDSLKKKLEATQKLEIDNAAKLAEQLKDTVLKFTRKATKTGKIYSAVTKENIAEMLNTQIHSTSSGQVGLRIQPDAVNLEEHEGGHVKQLGEHIIKVELAPEVMAEIKIKVSADTK